MPTVTTYSFVPPLGGTGRSRAAHAQNLRVAQVRVAAPFDGAALVYQLSPAHYVADPYNMFLADPGAIVGNRIAEGLEAAALFKAVAGPGSSVPAPLVLEVTVTELYGDFERGSAPAAVMAARFVLIDQARAHPQVAYERTISRRVPVPSASPESLVRGYGTALGEILTQLSGDLSNLIVN